MCPFDIRIFSKPSELSFCVISGILFQFVLSFFKSINSVKVRQNLFIPDRIYNIPNSAVLFYQVLSFFNILPFSQYITISIVQYYDENSRETYTSLPFLCLLVSRNCFAVPINDSAEFNDVCVTKLD